MSNTMKNIYLNNSLISVFPLFIFILGCSCVIKSEMIYYIINNYDLLFWFSATFVCSYLFLSDIRSVLVSIISIFNTALGMLFFIDFLGIEFSSVIVIVIITFLSVNVLLNIFLLIVVHQNKKSSEQNCDNAVHKTLDTHFWAILLTVVSVAFFLIISLVIAENNTQKLILGIGLVIVINSCLLLPLLCRLFLHNINEQRMQDDLEFTYSEKMIIKINERIEYNAARFIWIISPVVNNKIISLITSIISVLAAWLLFFSNQEILLQEKIFEDRSFSFLLLLYFFFLVLRYRSYILALAPVIAIILNYGFFWVICSLFLSQSPLLLHITFLGSLIITSLGIFSQTDLVVSFQDKKFSNNDILNGGAKIFNILFASVLVMTFFLLYAVYSDNRETTIFLDLIRSGIILIFSPFCALFPFMAFLKLCWDLKSNVNKPKKRRIKSIYL